MREMGIRMALGAHGASILALLMRGAVITAGAGIAFGGLAALVLVRFLETYLFGNAPRDPVAFTIACAVIGGSALLASMLPALRGARIDPNRVLRMEG
jgi:ABC-type antimicrobial peptide transport system permease subunit